MTKRIQSVEDARMEAADLRMIAAALGGEKFQYAPSLLSAALTIDRQAVEIRHLQRVIQQLNPPPKNSEDPRW